MYIILGATGHIGSAVIRQLVQHGASVTGITSNNDHASQIEKAGATAAVADVRDTETLTRIFKTGKRLYVLNPPAAPHTDTSEEEEKNIVSIVEAISKSSFEKIVVESTYGAQPGSQLGDLAVLYNLEQKVKAIFRTPTIIRGAYYYSNWDSMLHSATTTGTIYSLYPADFVFPMVAPADIALLAAKALQAPADEHPLFYIEGPRQYAPADVAIAFSRALQKEVEVTVIPESGWVDFLLESGFSTAAAQSMANMTHVTLYSKNTSDCPEKGNITLEEYIQALVDDKVHSK
ncbi:NAD(P)H-binding protein [Chitinophaga pendula]|uniref:NmrA family NAD(P)-binding protein n=1 Tax=Chitinophaga TaxID=79328 RepID=UPI000BAFE4DA|nr:MULTISPECIES: NAD(P)H-binding protein [Chitinophaga]ASZ13501.1 NmrA family transcriptional regulator [Chitinophaga sp. MD30]UCJ08870.1 NAD(P)H-binding protein [Chitinophaga pendula]